MQMQMQMPIRQQSSRICDITPPQILNESACLKKLTTYAVFTIQKVPAQDPKKDKATWARAEVNEERLEQVDIVKQVKKSSTLSSPFFLLLSITPLDSISSTINHVE
jgi:hypothetical protein